MSGVKLVLLLAVWLLTSLSSRAQSRTVKDAPATSQKELTVHLTLPTVVGLVGEYVGILSSKEKNKLKTISERNRPRTTSNPVLILTVPLPRLFTSDDKAPPKTN